MAERKIFFTFRQIFNRSADEYKYKPLGEPYQLQKGAFYTELVHRFKYWLATPLILFLLLYIFFIGGFERFYAKSTNLFLQLPNDEKESTKTKASHLVEPTTFGWHSGLSLSHSSKFTNLHYCFLLTEERKVDDSNPKTDLFNLKKFYWHPAVLSAQRNNETKGYLNYLLTYLFNLTLVHWTFNFCFRHIIILDY